MKIELRRARQEDREKGKAFSEKMAEILNYGALNLAMAIGYKTRLFDVMDETGFPQAASAIAEKALLLCSWPKRFPGANSWASIFQRKLLKRPNMELPIKN